MCGPKRKCFSIKTNRDQVHHRTKDFTLFNRRHVRLVDLPVLVFGLCKYIHFTHPYPENRLIDLLHQLFWVFSLISQSLMSLMKLV